MSCVCFRVMLKYDLHPKQNNPLALTAGYESMPACKSNFTSAPELLNYLRDEYSTTIKHIGRRATLTIVHSSDPAKHPGIVASAARSRPYKSYQPTAEHIAQALGQMDPAIENIAVTSDVGLLSQIANPDAPNPGLVWLNTAGVQGRDPMAQTPGLLEATGIPYVGHRPAAYTVSDDKILADAILKAEDVPTPRSFNLKGISNDQIEAISSQLIEGADEEPHILLKPINGRGSVGVERVNLNAITAPRLTDKLRSLSALYGGIKVDEYLPGEEVTVSAIQVGESVAVFPPLTRAIDPTTGIFESLDTQAVADRATVMSASDPHYQQIIDTTARAYRALGLGGLSRIDLRAKNDTFSVIDVNPKPDLGTPNKASLSEIGARACGLAFSDLIELMLLSRVERGFATHPDFEKSILN